MARITKAAYQVATMIRLNPSILDNYREWAGIEDGTLDDPLPQIDRQTAIQVAELLVPTATKVTVGKSVGVILVMASDGWHARIDCGNTHYVTPSIVALMNFRKRPFLPCIAVYAALAQYYRNQSQQRKI